MAIKQLSLNDFRNLKSITLDFDPGYNLIVGNNGSGKTSLLESINVICQGRSFKTHHINQCIQHGKKNFLLFAKFTNYQAGLSRTESKTNIRIDGTNIFRISELVEKTPVITIDSKCFELLTGPPSIRREYIDWCLFHVEHQYRDLWNDYARGLKQKNTLLKSRKFVKELDYWDEYLSSLCTKIYYYRDKYLKVLIKIISELNDSLSIEFDVEINFKQGWSNLDDPLASITENRQKELRFGYSIVGSHRDNIDVTIDELSVTEVLSRGQTKKLSISFLLAQILLVKQYTNKSIIILIDDLESELDSESVQNIVKLLSSLDIQVFITNIHTQPYLTEAKQEYKMFHVEHGMIKPVKNT
jgi:DNA replication and repair protein RecF